MAKDQIIVGLEIGTSKVCAVVGEARADGSLAILGIGEAPSRGVRKGEIKDYDTAQKCVQDALADAEEKADVMIKSVFLGVTGAHIESFNNRGSVSLPDDQEVIIDEDLCGRVRSNARAVSIPAQHTFIHTILQHYYVDGNDGVVNPVGMSGSVLEADFHIIHGVTNRLKNAMRCVKDLEVKVDDVVFNPFAAAQVVLDEHQKNLGALVVDCGGGTTDFIVYQGGAVKHSGVIAVGGDHVTNDISIGLRMPIARAEKLKCEEGCAQLGRCVPGETVALRDEAGFAGREIEREALNRIINARVRELFELLRRQLEPTGCLDFIPAGIFLTGGGGLLQGLKPVVEEVFDGLPVHLARTRPMAGVTSAFEDPRYSVALGLVRYGAAVQGQLARPGLFGWFVDKLRTLLTMMMGAFHA